MSIEIAFGREDGTGDREVRQLGAWIGQTDPETNGNIHHLINFGWVGGLDDVVTQLRQAIEDHPPTPNVRSTAEHLIDMIGTMGQDHLAAILGD
jgi:hypothetical protein